MCGVSNETIQLCKFRDVRHNAMCIQHNKRQKKTFRSNDAIYQDSETDEEQSTSSKESKNTASVQTNPISSEKVSKISKPAPLIGIKRPFNLDQDTIPAKKYLKPTIGTKLVQNAN